MKLKEGKYTLEKFAEKHGITRESALNLLTKLKKAKYITVSGGGKMKRIYTLTKLPKRETNGFYKVVNKYSPEKLQPKFEHYIYGNYSIEHAVIEGIKIGDIRTKEATMHLFRHITNWKKLFDLAKKERLEKELLSLYALARKTTKCKKMPKRYYS